MYEGDAVGRLLYMAMGWAVISGIYAFNVFRRGGRFWSMWFEVFSGGAGIFAIGLVIFGSASIHSNVLLAVFWGVVIVIFVGGWWVHRSRKKR